jgi:transposase
MVNIDRQTPMLLPPDLRDWVPEDDMVHFVLEAIEGMKLPSLHVNRRGSGSAQYPPRMMLALLVYCYSNGIFSSRRIERATYRDVAVRFLAGDTHPDHDTICKFRRENFDAIGEAFLQVLQLARQMGVLKVGTVSVDGTHIRANASKDRNVRYDRAGELDKQLQADIAELMSTAESADQEDANDGQTIPDEIARRERLRARMQEARAALDARAKERAASEQAAYERKLADREKREGKRKGKRPKPPDDTPGGSEQINLTDADSRLMRKNKREGYTQSYNAQAVVDADGSMLVVGGHVTNCASDANELLPALATVDESVGTVETVLADTGYVNVDAIDALAVDGIEAYIAVSRSESHTRRRYDYRPESAHTKPEKVIKDPRLIAMREKLETDQGREAYKKRKQTVEPVFGIIKACLGFRQFSLRGQRKVQGEWCLVTLAYNVSRLWRLVPQQ